MNKKILHVVMAALMLVGLLSLSACGSSDSKGDALQGTWKGTTNDGMDVTWTFDGKGGAEFTTPLLNKEKATYEIDGDKVSINVEIWGDAQNFTFEIKDKNLILTQEAGGWGPSYDLVKK